MPSPEDYLRQQVVRNSLTLDLAGSGGSSLPDLTPITVSILDQNGNFLRTDSTSVIASYGGGATSDFCSIFINSILPLFPDYDGSRDSIEIVMSTVSSISWSEPDVGPRIIRFDSTFAQNQQLAGYLSGANRLLFSAQTGGAGVVSVNSGAYDARSLGAHLTPGTIAGGWTDTVPTPGAKLTLSKTVSRRSVSYVSTQTDAALLNMGTADKHSFGLFKATGPLASRTLSQSASGVTFEMGSTTMVVRYIHFFHRKGD
jgi:hypothetical protein